MLGLGISIGRFAVSYWEPMIVVGFGLAPTITRDLSVDTDSHANPPHFVIGLPALPGNLTWIGAAATFTIGTDDAFTTPTSQVIIFSSATFESEFFGIARNVDIDLSTLLDNVPAGPFRLECAIQIPSTDGSPSVTINSAVYSATLNSPATTIGVSDAPTVPEGNTGATTPLVFPVTSFGADGYEKKADWTAQGAGANPAPASELVGGVFPSGTITIPAGQNTGSITLEIQGNTAFQPDYGVEIILTNVRTTGYGSLPNVPGTVGANDAQGIIANDDSPTYTTNAVWLDNNSNGAGISNGGKSTSGGSGSYEINRTTTGVADGQVIWFEVTGATLIGVMPASSALSTNSHFYNHPCEANYGIGNAFFIEGNQLGAASLTPTDVMQMLIDRENHILTIFKNGTQVGTGSIADFDPAVVIYPAVELNGATATITANSAPPAGASYL